MRLLSLFLALFLWSAQSALAGALPDAPHIIVEGRHQITTTPDTLKMSLQVIDVGRDLATVSSSVEKQSKSLLQSLKDVGIEKKDISSAALTVTPKYNWNNKQQVYNGTQVSRRIELTLRNLELYDTLIQAIVKGNVARVNSSQLTSSKLEELEASAMQQAVTDAQARAAMLVATLPQKIGPVYAITAVSQSSRPRGDMYRVANTGAMQKSAFEPGTITVSKSVQVVFYLIDK